MPTRWIVRTSHGSVSGWYGSEEDARTHDGGGRLVPDTDGRSAWSYELPSGWTIEHVDLPELSEELVMALAYLAAQCDGGCAHCVGRQTEELRIMWPDVDWTAAVTSVSAGPEGGRADDGRG